MSKIALTILGRKCQNTRLTMNSVRNVFQKFLTDVLKFKNFHPFPFCLVTASVSTNSAKGRSRA